MFMIVIGRFFRFVGVLHEKRDQLLQFLFEALFKNRRNAIDSLRHK